MTLIDTKSVAIFAHNFNTDDNSFISNSNEQTNNRKSTS